MYSHGPTPYTWNWSDVTERMVADSRFGMFCFNRWKHRMCLFFYAVGDNFKQRLKSTHHLRYDYFGQTILCIPHNVFKDQDLVGEALYPVLGSDVGTPVSLCTDFLQMLKCAEGAEESSILDVRWSNGKKKNSKHVLRIISLNDKIISLWTEVCLDEIKRKNVWNVKCLFHDDKKPSARYYAFRGKYVCYANGCRVNCLNLYKQLKAINHEILSRL